MEDHIGTALHWSDQKEPEQAKSKDGVIGRNLDRIRVSAATPLPSKTRAGTAKWVLFNNNKIKIKNKNPIQKKNQIILAAFV